MSEIAFTSAARLPEAHLFDSGFGPALLNVNSMRIHEIDPLLAENLDLCIAAGDSERVRLLMTAFGLGVGPGGSAGRIDPPPVSVAVRTFSLAIAQKCNLGCTYCYADQGTFGGAASNMSPSTAAAAVDRLLDGVERGQEINLVFLGGEPLANREALRSTVRYAAAKADGAGITTRFSLTTNATLLTAEDADFFEQYPFSLTVSIDGIGDAHDRLRPFKSGRGSFDRIVERVRPLLARPRRRTRVNARVTVTPQNLAIADTLTGLTEMGFDGVQLSPMLSSPSRRGQMDGDTLAVMLAQMIDCGRQFEADIAKGRLLPFSNMISTLRQIHRGGRDDYPCGAGGSYLGVAADGELYACHRFVGDEARSMGNVDSGIDRAKQTAWLAERHVENQPPCKTCWARHLCGGSCHYEAINAGRQACDYIRGWLHYCLGAYVRLQRQSPERLREVLG